MNFDKIDKLIRKLQFDIVTDDICKPKTDRELNPQNYFASGSHKGMHIPTYVSLIERDTWTVVSTKPPIKGPPYK